MDKTVKIGISTTADTSGALAAKKSIEDLIVARKPLEDVRSQFMSAREAEVAEIDRLVESARKAKPPLEDLPAAQNAVTKSTRNMNFAVLEASRAFEDAQYGIRGVLNNIPGLVMALGGTAGIAGAASLAAVAVSILGPKIAELLGSADETKGLEDFENLLGDVTKRLQDVAAEKGRAAGKEWVGALDDEEAAIRRQNLALDSQNKILEARRQALEAIARAERERRKVEIDANPDLSEADKIRAKAGIDQEGLAADASSQLTALQSNVEAARRDAEQKEAAVKRVAADLAAAEAEQARLESERDQAQRAIKDQENAQKVKPELEDRKKELESERFWRLGFDTSADTSDLDEKIANLEMRLQAAENAPSILPTLKKNKEGIDSNLAEVSGGVGAQKTALESARQAAEDARRKAEEAAAVAREQSRGITGGFNANSSAAKTRTDAAAREAERREAERIARENEQAEKERLQAEFKATQENLSGLAGINRSKIRNSEAARGNSELSSLADEIGRADTTSEINAVRDAVKASSQGLGSAVVSAMTAMIAKQEVLANQLNNLKSRIDKMR